MDTEETLQNDRGPAEVSGLEFHGTPEQLAALFGAVAKAQGAIPPIPKTRTVRVQGKDGRPLYAFDYAPMETILEATRAPLADNGLAVMFPASKDTGPGIVLSAIVAHESGGYMLSRFRVPSGGDVKETGANLTYAQRYVFSKLLNLAADGDADELPTKNEGPVHAEDRAPRGRVQSPPPPPKQEAQRAQKPEPTPEPAEETKARPSARAATKPEPAKPEPAPEPAKPAPKADPAPMTEDQHALLSTLRSASGMGPAAIKRTVESVGLDLAAVKRWTAEDGDRLIKALADQVRDAISVDPAGADIPLDRLGGKTINDVLGACP